MSDFTLPTPPPTIPPSPKPTLRTSPNHSNPHPMLKPFIGNQPDALGLGGAVLPDSRAKYEDFGFATRAIHVGSEPDPVTGAVIPPLSMATTYAQSGVSIYKYDYARSTNPTRNALESLLSSLEYGSDAIAFSSGSAGTAAACQWVALPKKEGGARGEGEGVGRILSVTDVYGGTYRYLKRVGETTTNVAIDFIDLANASEGEILKAIKPDTKLIWLEAPSNPLLTIPPLPFLSRTIRSIAPSRRPLILVDNTFLSPYWSNPLTLGADLVLHSISKYLGGHSDVIMGALVVGRGEGMEDVARGLRFLQNASGGIPSPFDCYQVQRSIKTLSLRCLKHGLNALYLANKLKQSPYITEVKYPGLKGDKFYGRAREGISEVAKRDLRQLGWKLSDDGKDGADEKLEAEGGFPYSGMITIRLRATESQTQSFLQNLHLFVLAESLGGVESLAEAPWKMTHGGIPEADRLKFGITENLVRLSVGIEEAEDLWGDLEGALERALGVKGEGEA